jgi:hypothetical protein
MGIALSRPMPGRTEVIHEKRRLRSQCPVAGSNRAPPEFKSGILRLSQPDYVHPSPREADILSAGQRFPAFTSNSNIYYRVHKSSPVSYFEPVQFIQHLHRIPLKCSWYVSVLLPRVNESPWPDPSSWPSPFDLHSLRPSQPSVTSGPAMGTTYHVVGPSVTVDCSVFLFRLRAQISSRGPEVLQFIMVFLRHSEQIQGQQLKLYRNHFLPHTPPTAVRFNVHFCFELLGVWFRASKNKYTNIGLRAVQPGLNLSKH